MISRFSFAITVLAIACAYSAVSNADDCDVIVSDPCESAAYANLHLNGSHAPSCAINLKCLGPHEPPAHLSLICEATGHQFICEAWPRGKPGEDFSYDWFATGALTMTDAGPSSSPLNSVSCQSGSDGFVSVVVTSPYGLSSTYFQELSCP